MFSDTLELYTLAKYINRDVFTEGQLQSAGTQQSRFLEKMEKNNHYIRNNLVMVKIIYGFVLSFMPIFPLIVFFQINESIGGISFSAIYFTGGFLFSIFFALNFFYLLLFGMFNSSSLMTGESFQWLQTLPIPKKKLNKLAFWTLFRGFDIPLIAMIFSFPIFMLIGTGDLIFSLICLITSIPNVLFSFSILIYIGEKLSRVLFEKTAKSKKSNVLRIITMGGFILISFSLGFVIQFALASVDLFFNLFISFDNSANLNLIFSLIPYPFAPAFLVSLFSATTQVPINLWITNIIGFALFLILTYVIYQGALKSLRSITSATKKAEEFKIDTKDLKEVEVEVSTLNPITAYVKKDLTTATRDFQTFMFLLMPIILPIIMIFSASSGVDYGESNIVDIFLVWVFTFLSTSFVPPMLISGFLNMEDTGASVTASLPVIPREQAKAKLIIILSVQTIAFIIAPFVFMAIFGLWEIFILILGSIPIAWTMLLLMFELKVLLFGKMKYKYILEELHREKKILKWILMIIANIGIFVVTLILVIGLGFFIDIWIVSLILFSLGMLSSLILWYGFNKMFPNPEDMIDYKTGGVLRNQPVLGVLAVTVLYAIFVIIPEFAELPLILPLLGFLNPVGLYFIDFLFTFGFLAMLLLLIIPKGLKLPFKGQNLRNYLINIGLSEKGPLVRNVLIGLGSFFLIAFSFFFGGIILGTFTFDLGILFGTPTFFTLGWFLFIFMLIPGIWEEIAFRGIMIPLMERKYKQYLIIIISGIAFGIVHTVNFINIVGGANPYFIILQIIYASLLGFGLGYMFLKTRSLIPTIILHYLIDSVGQLFLNISFNDELSVTIYLLVFVGLIPMLIVFLISKLFAKE